MSRTTTKHTAIDLSNLPKLDDLQDLLARIALGDRKAFSRLYKQTSPHLFGSLIRILKDQSLAEDALQEVYVQIWNNSKNYNLKKSKPMTWLYSIARYRAIDVLRERRISAYSEPISSNTEARHSSLIYFDQYVEHNQGLLDKCLAELHDDQRSAIIKCYCEGYSHSELSQAMNSPLGTIKSWIRRGIMSLKECMSR